MIVQDWTQGADGRSNSSGLFKELITEVVRLIRNDAYALLTGNIEGTARLILAQLAHKHGLAPRDACVQACAQHARVAAFCAGVPLEVANNIATAICAGPCSKGEQDCGDPRCKTHHSDCLVEGGCWHDVGQCQRRERVSAECLCDAVGDGPCPAHAVEMAMQDKRITQENARCAAAPSVPSSSAAAVEPLCFMYRNHRGEVEQRRVLPKKVWFGKTVHHSEPQWLLDAEDLDRQALRTFAMKGMVPPPAASPAPLRTRA